MLSLCLTHFLRHILQFRRVVLNDFLRTAYPRTLSEDAFHVFCEDHLTLDEEFSQLVMSLAVLLKDGFGACILVITSSSIVFAVVSE